jgi:hypothetical protein
MIHMAAELLFVDTVIRDERFMHQVLQCWWFSVITNLCTRVNDLSASRKAHVI